MVGVAKLHCRDYSCGEGPERAVCLTLQSPLSALRRHRCGRSSIGAVLSDLNGRFLFFG